MLKALIPFVFWGCVLLLLGRRLPRPFSLVWPHLTLWLAAQLGRFGWKLPKETPTFASVKSHAGIFEAVEKGEPIELLGVTIRKPAVAIGRVIAKRIERRVVPGTEQYSSHWFGLEFTNTVWLAYGYRTRSGRVRTFVKEGGEFRSTEWNTPRYGVAEGETVLVVYDSKGRGQVAFSLRGGPGAGPVRTAFRKS